MAYAAYKRIQNLIADGQIPSEDDWAHVYAWRKPMTLAELLADTGVYAGDVNNPAEGEFVAGDRIWTKDGYILDVAASGASDHDRTTAGGVKLYDIDVSPALIEARVTTLEGAGVQGPEGKSAYEVAVDEGFVGDESAWLASLQGTDGADGAQGPAGADGADGTNVTITVVADQAAFDAATPGATELVVLYQA